MEDFEICYTKKDLILYALSLGMGSSKDDSNEIKFLCEKHDKFAAVPTFAFALTFWAAGKGNNTGTTTNTTTQGIPPFPPPLMASEEVIPRRFLRESGSGIGGNAIDISNFHVIHTWQSIVWHQPLAVPLSNKHKQTRKDTMMRRQADQIRTNINLETISVQPKSIGAFVTSQSKVTTIGYSRDYNSKNNNNNKNNNQLLCTMQSTALVLGVDSNNVIAFDAGIQRLTSNKPKIPSVSNTKNPIFHWTYQTSQSQALLYRMTSGDSNLIHVDTSASDMLGSDTKAPLLHGLFTLALAFRAIIKLIDGNYNSSFDIDDDDYEVVFRRLEGKFKSPAFVGDCLCVKVWNDETKISMHNTKSFLFVITNHVTGKKLVDCGNAEVEIVSKFSSTKKSRL
jgi:acyl dehydratase